MPEVKVDDEMEENKKESVETSMPIYVFEIQKERKPIISRLNNKLDPEKNRPQEKENGTSDDES